MKKKLVQLFAFMLTTIFLSSCSIGGGNSGDIGTSSNDSENSGNEQTQFTDIVLAKNGTSDYKIVIPANAADYEKKAAEHLQEYVKKSTNAVLPIVNDSNQSFNQTNKVISIGDTKVFDGCGMTVDSDELNVDGYKIKRYGNTVVVNGANDKSTLYGVYGFLDKEINYEAYWTDEIYYEKAETLLLYDFDLVDIPDFFYRGQDGAVKNNKSLQDTFKIEDGLSYLPGSSHSFWYIITKDEYQAAHPNWFSKTQLCFNAEGLEDAFVSECIDFLKANKTATWFNMSQMDGYGWCTCSKCYAEYNQYRVSGYLIRHLNAIIERLEAWIAENQPGRKMKYNTLIYAGPDAAPVEETYDENGNTVYEIIDESCRPHEKLYCEFAPLMACFSHALTDPKCTTNKAWYQQYTAWSSITDRFNMWFYGTDYRMYLNFYDNYSALAENFRWFKELGVNWLSMQTSSGSRNRSMNDLQIYLFSKLSWDTSLDTEELIEDFMTHYYKEAAPAMSSYLKFIRTHIKAKENAPGASYGPYCQGSYAMRTSLDLWPVEIVEQELAYIDQAFALAKTNPDLGMQKVLYDRILKESVCARFLQLYNYTEYYIVDINEYNALLDEWERDCVATGCKYSEPKSIAAFVEELRAKVK